MAKKLFILTTVLMFSLINFASALDLSPLLNQVTSELIKKGVAAADVNTIQPAVSNLLGLGMNKESLVRIVTGLAALRINGNILNNPLQALIGLVQSGQKPSIASNLISLAIDQAKTQNLTGNAAVSKVVDFINQKTANFLSLKQQAQGSVQEQKNKINQSLGSLLGK